jgi:hypothetical protein
MTSRELWREGYKRLMENWYANNNIQSDTSNLLTIQKYNKIKN